VLRVVEVLTRQHRLLRQLHLVLRELELIFGRGESRRQLVTLGLLVRCLVGAPMKTTGVLYTWVLMMLRSEMWYSRERSRPW
jgi:hypothetical protein